MSCGDKNKPSDSAHVSLFPSPPWQLVTKHHSPSSESPVRPPTPPGTNVYRMFGNLYNLDDAILRSLESQGVRRVYPQTYNRKRELRKINFSILANYLDLLDIITRDPSSTKRTERLDNLAVLFINMHHLVNEYRQHQARDLLREILKYQVTVASQTVEKAEQYMTRADEILRNAGCDLVLPNQSSGLPTNVPSTLPTNYIDTVRSGLSDLGPSLAPLLQTVLDETMGVDPTGRRGSLPSTQRGGISLLEQRLCENSKPSSTEEYELAEHLDPILWRFLTLSKLGDPSQDDFSMDV
ncbi:MED7 protein [Opisthorchis viverrini]|uniref:Mediator of RNA polymerase II transcription subunit 7 n=2 Tax=Opisthorchis viverrini TaxID=6198 RepID=A0A075A0L7_OPIVI|nr:hypothetical protein T265_04180 [Opisthorchis viverrini]KER29085.1 hypothetical protein T265_04180 [Opisthorchis viverrini]OON22116.1 MED7 protein [Opisthorchis viverrini]